MPGCSKCYDETRNSDDESKQWERILFRLWNAIFYVY